MILGAAVLASAMPVAAAPTIDESPGITGVLVDVAHIHHDVDSNGDTWDLAWANDDNLYTFADDSRGYSHGHGSRNVNFNVLTGSNVDSLVGRNINMMGDYGNSGQECPNGATWKSTGCDCIDGVLYAFVAPNWYGDHHAYGIGPVDPYLRQTVVNMSLIKSADFGKTWSRSEAENYAHPMWTSFKFSTAYFFKYGKNGGSGGQDDHDKFVYAISNDGYWNDGENFYLGRVRRAKIGDLNPADWQFYHNDSWTKDVDDATPIPGFANGQVKCASGSPIWLPAMRKYVTVTWYNPEPADTRLKWDFPADRVFDFYQADHPWGPWSIVGEKKATDFLADTAGNVHRWYGPSLCSKFIATNPDKSVTAIMSFSGQTWEDQPSSLYKCNLVPVTFYATPRPRLLQWLNDNDPSITYSDGWVYEPHFGKGDYRGDEHRSSIPGSTATINFLGSGIEILAAKSTDLGEIDVIVDGVSAGRFSECQNPFPRLYQIPIYRDLNLPYGQHTALIVNRAPAGTFVTLDGYKTYGDGANATTPPVSVIAAGNTYLAKDGMYGSTEIYQDTAASHGVGTCKLDVTPGSGVRFADVAAGNHVVIRYCTAYDPGKLSLYLNGEKVQDVTLPLTGAWAGNYATVTVPIKITAGSEIKLQYDPGDVAANIDCITIN
jgi:hypothetical protein